MQRHDAGLARRRLGRCRRKHIGTAAVGPRRVCLRAILLLSRLQHLLRRKPRPLLLPQPRKYRHTNCRRMSARTTSTNSIRLCSTYATRGSTTAHTAANTESIAAYTLSPYCVMHPAINIIPDLWLRRSGPDAGPQRHTATMATRCVTCATTTSVPTTDKAHAETTSHSQTNSKSNRRQRPSVRKRNSKARAATAMPKLRASV